MGKETDNTKISEDNLAFIKTELSQSNKPVSLKGLTKKLAFQKTSSQLSQEVKKYNPDCQYEVENLIYKEYDELLMMSSKGTIPFRGGVVLKVINKIVYKNYDCELIEVDYTGGGPFRKHIDYMKKTKTQVLLPSNQEGKNLAPETLKPKEDPRLNELPMTDKDLRILEKTLKTRLSQSNGFFCWKDLWQLKEKQVEIPEKKIAAIEQYLLESKQSASTSDLVTQLFKIQPSNDLFDLHCISLNSILEKKHKKKIALVCPVAWGKWLTKKTLESFLENLPITAPKAKLPHFERENEEEISFSKEFPIKIYLTWREIFSGGIKISKELNKELSQSREYIFTDVDGKKDYTVYYYPSLCVFLGLKDFFENNNVPQGASLTLEKTGLNKFNFWLKKSKKKLSISKISYDSEEDKFKATGEEFFTYSLLNKIIHLENESLSRLFSFYGKRDNADLRELLILIYKNFGLKKENLHLHYLRAFHLVDMLIQTTQEDVERTLLNSHEFVKSEKKKGVFLYKEKIKTEEELQIEEDVEIPPEKPLEERPEGAQAEQFLEIGAIEEIVTPEEHKKEEEIAEERQVKAAPEIQKTEIEKELETKAATPPKEKGVKQKKQKLLMETERLPRKRKGVKKHIEEKIELEESELEAFIAVKAEKKKDPEDTRESAQKKAKEEKYKPVASEEPEFGLFAEKLKSALGKKGKKKK
ncbi:hypothetical protein ACFLRM_07030 [Acidobacteriota bacterium]